MVRRHRDRSEAAFRQARSGLAPDQCPTPVRPPVGKAFFLPLTFIRMLMSARERPGVLSAHPDMFSNTDPTRGAPRAS